MDFEKIIKLNKDKHSIDIFLINTNMIFLLDISHDDESINEDDIKIPSLRFNVNINRSSINEF